MSALLKHKPVIQEAGSVKLFSVE